jgi:hypothetical protein
MQQALNLLDIFLSSLLPLQEERQKDQCSSHSLECPSVPPSAQKPSYQKQSFPAQENAIHTYNRKTIEIGDHYLRLYYKFEAKKLFTILYSA